MCWCILRKWRPATKNLPLLLQLCRLSFTTEEVSLGEGDGEKKWAGKFGRVDPNPCGVASQPLPRRWFGASASTVRSAQRRAEESGQREPPPPPPGGGKHCSSCSMLISPRLTCPVFSLRLVPRLTGSFEAFPRGDVDAVIWMALLGPDPPWRGPAVARLPAHSGHFLIAERGAVVRFHRYPFSSRTDQPVGACVCPFGRHLRWMLARSVPP